MTSTSSSPPPCSIRELLGVKPSSQKLVGYTKWLALCAGIDGADITPEIKSYPDAVYFNYYPIGLSIMFAPSIGYKPANISRVEDLKSDLLAVDSIDLYHTPSPLPPAATKAASPPATKAASSPYSSFAGLPLELQLHSPTMVNENRHTEIAITGKSTGKDIVATLGEPDRKGGGSGPTSGSINIWCEWSKEGLMIEFGGEQARGPQAWERGKDALWKIITIFAPKL
jgi:hypothetical protein